MDTGDFIVLTIWDNLSDPYDHVELANNWKAVDVHDHTGYPKGKKLTAAAFENGSVGSGQIADNSIYSNHIVNGEVKTVDLGNGAVTADKMDTALLGAIVPLGAVIPWYRPSGAVSVPYGWVLCTGQSLTQANHDWAGAGTITVPNLTNRFVMGVAAGADEKVAGGNNAQTFNHTHTVPTHTHVINSHVHTVGGHAHNIPTDGAHGHVTGQAWRGNVNVEGNKPSVHDYPEPFAFQDHGHDISLAGAHNHTGATGQSTVFNTGGSGQLLTSETGDVVTSSAQVSGDTRPAYVGLLYIMKVRTRPVA